MGTETTSGLQILDVAAVLQRVGGNEQIVRSLLCTFLENHAGIVTKMRLAWQDGDVFMTKTHAHTLKGVAGILGMDRLFAAATDLDRTLGEGVNPDIEPLLMVLERAHGDVLAHLAGIGIPRH
jgi:HPt (histidine-containing phosphotransfer) domain-containing protein